MQLRRWAAAGVLAGAVTLVGGWQGLKAQAAPAGKPEVYSVDAAGLKKAVAAHRGKVVVLNLWATWCGPCVEEFPDLVKLQKVHGKQGVVVLAVSTDEPSDKAEVVKFMADAGAPFSAYMRKSGDTPEFLSTIDQKWSGAIPTTYIFDRQGKQVGAPIVGRRSYDQFAAKVKPLLK